MSLPLITALVPMRHSSERVEGKNYRNFAGRPLYHHIVSALLHSRTIGQVVIDTDSPFIREDAALAFPSVVLLERPEHLRGGEVPMNDVLLHTVQQLAADFFLQTHSTNPLLTPKTIDRAVETFLDAQPDADSLFSVTRLQARLWTDQGLPLNHDPAVLLRTQDLPPVFEENSNIYIFSAQTLRKHGNRIGATPLLFEIGAGEAMDIDEELDFQIAELLFKHDNQGSACASRS